MLLSVLLRELLRHRLNLNTKYWTRPGPDLRHAAHPAAQSIIACQHCNKRGHIEK